MFSRASILATICAVVIICSANPLQPRCWTGKCARSYTVVKGDTCQRIEAKEGVSSFQLSSANPGVIDTGCDNLEIGQKLCLGIVGEDCQVTHVIKRDETCQSIATKAKTTLKILQANNPTTDCDDELTTGDVLCTADEVIVQPCHNS
ncbi:hypothetical protein C8Q80DRAFT_1264158 [Daedaleopsis nitida]|nr:hypothetical protein C8Q80DRAFT_1264158 [Daedaleopsis nitida]